MRKKKISLDDQIKDSEQKKKMYLDLACQEQLRYERLLKKRYPIKQNTTTLATFH